MINVSGCVYDAGSTMSESHLCISCFFCPFIPLFNNDFCKHVMICLLFLCTTFSFSFVIDLDINRKCYGKTKYMSWLNNYLAACVWWCICTHIGFKLIVFPTKKIMLKIGIFTRAQQLWARFRFCAISIPKLCLPTWRVLMENK